MVEVEPFPFATLSQLKDRWPDFPAGADSHANILLEDASQFILDIVPAAANASEATRRRVVCAVVRRSMEASTADTAGMETLQQSAGPFSYSVKPVNPNGDFYLTKAEKQALSGPQKAFGVALGGVEGPQHAEWCSLNFGATYCSCGADIAGFPIYGNGA